MIAAMKGFILLLTFGFAGMTILLLDNIDYIYISNIIIFV